MKSLQNIETSFQLTKTIAIVAVLASLIYSLIITFLYFKNTHEAAERVYIMSSGAAIEAFSSNVRENRPAEVRHHLKRLHELFFTISPDPKSIERNMGKAYYYGDASIKKLYEAYSEKQYYYDLISANASQEINIDSVFVDMKDYPFTAKCFATININRSTTKTTRTLVTDCTLMEINRSDNNPHGLMVQNWRVVENKDIKTEDNF